MAKDILKEAREFEKKLLKGNDEILKSSKPKSKKKSGKKKGAKK